MNRVSQMSIEKSHSMGNEGKGVVCWTTTIAGLTSESAFQDSSGTGNIPRKELHVPSYQRPYAWKSEHVRRMCRDLLTARGEYHLGTIVLQCSPGENVWMIVDGQQRLTTAGVILGSPIVWREGVGNSNGFTSKDKKQIEEVLGEFSSYRTDLINKLKACTIVCILVEDISEAFQLFDTQNGRGKSLSPVNLLKAFHFHEYIHSSDSENDENGSLIKKLELRWESSNTLRAGGGRGERLLVRLFAEHLYRIRCWCRGEFEVPIFSKEQIGEFKGVTVGRKASSSSLGEEQALPVQNTAVLRKIYRDHFGEQMLQLYSLGKRLFPDDSIKGVELDPFVFINQAIVNGEDFFNYANTFAEMYKLLFPVFPDDTGGSVAYSSHPVLKFFHEFYFKYCLYLGEIPDENHPRKLYRSYECRRWGDTYARHVYESLCLFCFDRFGQEGLMRFHKDIFRLAYYERATRERLHYSAAGRTFATRCSVAFLRSETLSELGDELRIIEHDLYRKMDDEDAWAFDGRNTDNKFSVVTLFRKEMMQ